MTYTCMYSCSWSSITCFTCFYTVCDHKCDHNIFLLGLPWTLYVSMLSNIQLRILLSSLISLSSRKATKENRHCWSTTCSGGFLLQGQLYQLTSNQLHPGGSNPCLEGLQSALLVLLKPHGVVSLRLAAQSWDANLTHWPADPLGKLKTLSAHYMHITCISLI